MNLDNNILLLLIAGIFVILYLTTGNNENMRDLSQRHGRQKKLSGRSAGKVYLDESKM